MTNEELFQEYDAELKLRLRNAKDLNDHRRMLDKFRKNIGDYPPSVALAKSFLSQYTDRKPRTLARYTKMIGGLMKYLGEPLDITVKVPKSLPEYIKDNDIEKLKTAVKNKKSHKSCIVRDLLLIDLAQQTGMRRGELANLEPVDIHDDILVVRSGKGKKDRSIPLLPEMSLRLKEFTKDMAPHEKVFKLTGPSIGNKIRLFGKKAGVNIHTHSLRDKFGTDLLEVGANIRQVQTLMGHNNLSTTESYLALKDGSLQEAIEKLGNKWKKNHKQESYEQELEIEKLEREVYQLRLKQAKL